MATGQDTRRLLVCQCMVRVQSLAHSKLIFNDKYSMYIHCPAADYDEWATKYNATGWAWKDLQPFFRKAEMFTPNALWPVDDSIRGKEGPWQTTYPKFLSPLADGFFRACSNLGYPTIPDINHGHERCVHDTQSMCNYA